LGADLHSLVAGAIIRCRVRSDAWVMVVQKGGEHAPGCVAQGGLVRPGGAVSSAIGR